MSIPEMQQALKTVQHTTEVHSAMSNALKAERALTPGWAAALIITERCLELEQRLADTSN